MKKFLITSFSVAIFLFAAINRPHAQHTGKAEFRLQPEFISKYFESKTFLDSSGETPVTEISTKAVRHFVKSFKRAENVRWIKTDNGSVAFFKLNGVRSRADYNKKGNWLYNIRSYGESELPEKIRAIVKSTFYDYSITWINEVSDDQQVAYIIEIEDKTTLKTVSVYEGELRVMKEFVKSK